MSEFSDSRKFVVKPDSGITTILRSDFADGIHPQCISCIFFIVLAAMAPSITFGGLISKLKSPITDCKSVEASPTNHSPGERC